MKLKDISGIKAVPPMVQQEMRTWVHISKITSLLMACTFFVAHGWQLYYWLYIQSNACVPIIGEQKKNQHTARVRMEKEYSLIQNYHQQCMRNTERVKALIKELNYFSNAGFALDLFDATQKSIHCSGICPCLRDYLSMIAGLKSSIDQKHSLIVSCTKKDKTSASLLVYDLSYNYGNS